MMKLFIKLIKNNYIFILGGILVIYPFFSGSMYIYQVAIVCALYSVMTISLNLLMGFTGQLSLGHVAFYAIGSYSSAILSMNFGVPVMISMVLAGLIAAFFGFIVSFPAIRLTGVYLGIATMGFAEIVRQIALIWTPVTGGPMGLPGVPQPSIFNISINNNIRMYVLILIILALVCFFTNRLVKSRIGLAFLAIKDDEVAAESMGINIRFYKMLAFVLSALIMGFSGSFFVHFIRFAAPGNFTSTVSFLVLSMYALGGPASLVGSITGATLIIIAQEVFRFAQAFRPIIYAMLLFFIIIFKPDGIAGILKINKITAGLPRNESSLILKEKALKEKALNE